MVKDIQAAEADRNAELAKYADAQWPNLIHKAEIDHAIVKALEAYFRHLDNAAEVGRLSTSDEAAEQLAFICRAYDGRVWTGVNLKEERLDANGNKVLVDVPKCTTCKSGISYQKAIIPLVQSKLLENWVSETPTLTHEPDARRFIEICKQLFPNVLYPHRAANGFRDFIENVHSSCGTEGAKFCQKALWLYSLKVGGTGKSWLLEVIRKALVDMGVDADYESFKQTDYLSPMAGLHTVTISEDTPKLDSSMAETLNTLIDRSTFRYNIKWGASGLAKSNATLIFGSNFESFEANARRYNLVEYLQKNIISGITDEERAAYFPLWGDEEKAVEAVQEAFRVAPFKSEHGEWKAAIGDDSRDVGTRHYATLQMIQEAVEDGYFSDTDDLTRMRTSKVAKVIAGQGGMNRREVQGQLLTFLAELKARGQLPGNNCEGRTPLVELRLDWKKIAALTCGETVKESGKGALADIAADWDGLLADEF